MTQPNPALYAALRNIARTLGAHASALEVWLGRVSGWVGDGVEKLEDYANEKRDGEDR